MQASDPPIRDQQDENFIWQTVCPACSPKPLASLKGTLREPFQRVDIDPHLALQIANANWRGRFLNHFLRHFSSQAGPFCHSEPKRGIF